MKLAAFVFENEFVIISFAEFFESTPNQVNLIHRPGKRTWMRKKHETLARTHRNDRTGDLAVLSVLRTRI